MGFRWSDVVLSAVLLGSGGLSGRAQTKGTAGEFDFYLLNVVPAAEFCGIADVGPGCARPAKAWVLHGLWAQRNDGTYPVFCADRAGPKQPERNLDLTPDLPLLDHEWRKHGTCTTLTPERFFALERRAFARLIVPSALTPSLPVSMRPQAIFAEFARANPQLPESSLVIWCSGGRLTSVSVCLGKDLKAVACQGLKSCAEETVVVPAAGRTKAP